MADMHSLDDSKLIINQSGGVPGGPAGPIPHIRPYGKKFRLDYMDDHTVGSESRFQEADLFLHRTPEDIYKDGSYGRINPLSHDNIVYWGEVRCYAGPDNWYKLVEQASSFRPGRTGYGAETSRPLAQKVRKFFDLNDLSNNGSRVIKQPGDVSVQAGRGLMYINGRLNQVLMSQNSQDGFAINGWSGGASILPPDHSKFLEWYSAIVDEGRNLKGPASDYKYWNRPLQLAMFRKNGKYFVPGDTIRIEANLINEGILPAGEYQVNLTVLDGNGHKTEFAYNKDITIAGGDSYAQLIDQEVSIKTASTWKAGYLTVYGTVSQGGKVVAYGTEQVLFKNRPSYRDELESIYTKVYEWPAAKKALEESHENTAESKQEVILAGEVPPKKLLNSYLKKVKAGSALILRFDEVWAKRLFDINILKSPVTEWGGTQEAYWNGNGWGYIDALIGDQAIPGKTTIGTNSWEVSGNPKGFYPFESKYPQTAYGAWMARHDTFLVLLGEIEYGLGKIILAPTYPVDENNAFNDLLFFNIIMSSIKK